MNLQDFASDFYHSIELEWEEKGGQREQIFVDRFCDYLESNGVIRNYDLCFWMKSGIGIKVNGYCYEEDEKRLDLFVAEYDQISNQVGSISRTEVSKILKRAIKFFEYAAKKRLANSIDFAYRDAHDLASLIENVSGKIEELNVYLLTNSVYKSNELVEIEAEGVERTQFHIWDIERLYQLVNELQGVETITIDFAQEIGESFEMMLVPTDTDDKAPFDCYIGFIPGTLLAKAYEKWGQRLIERNVRSFLQARGKVNKGIKETLQHKKNMFVAYNNGVSTTADDARITPVQEGTNLYRVDSLSGWQIVNGGQTTASLYHAWDSDVDITNVYIQAKLTVLKDTDETVSRELISRISQYANTQNKISFSDLGANDSIHVTLEHLSRSIWAPDPMGRKSEKKWYYERARGQYLVDTNRQPTRAKKLAFTAQNPKSHVITKTQFAKYFMAWEQFPHVVSKGSEYNFSAFMKYVDEDKKLPIDADFFKSSIARGLLFNTCDKIVSKMELPGYKANVVAYTVAMFAHAAGHLIDLLKVWNAQQVSEEIQKLIAEVAKVTWAFISNPPSQGTNISQWCKKEDCWIAFLSKHGVQIKQLATTFLVSEVPQVASAETAATSETQFDPIVGMDYVDLPLTSSRNELEVPMRSGLNWGQREGRNPNQAYVSIPLHLHREKEGFFPPQNEHFLVKTTDGMEFRCKVCQDGGKALECSDDNSSLGVFFRERLGVSSGQLVEYIHLEQYGRFTVRLYKLGDLEYLLDF